MLAATVVGNWIPGSPLEPYFSLTQRDDDSRTDGYGFIASVLPVWLLLCPRDYLSSFLKIGTIALADRRRLRRQSDAALPADQSRASLHGGPTFSGRHLPVRFHLHHVRRDLGLSRPGLVRHHAEDDRQGKRTSGPSATAPC